MERTRTEATTRMAIERHEEDLEIVNDLGASEIHRCATAHVNITAETKFLFRMKQHRSLRLTFVEKEPRALTEKYYRLFFFSFF